MAGTIRILFHPSYSSNLEFDLTHPLLRNFRGTINSVQITLAQNTDTVNQLILVNQVLSVIAQVEHPQWELVFTPENLKVARETLRAAEEILSSTQAKVTCGIQNSQNSGPLNKIELPSLHKRRKSISGIQTRPSPHTKLQVVPEAGHHGLA